METTTAEGTARRRIRLAGRVAALVVAVALVWPLWPELSSAAILPALSPFVGLLSALALRSWVALTFLCVPVLLVAVFWPRWFCRCACPAGLLQDAAAALCRRRHATWLPPALGPWIVMLTVGGAFLGYPFLLWLDPLALFSAFVSALHQPPGGAMLVAGLGLPLLLLLSIALPKAWCVRLCPLGASQETLATVGLFARRVFGRQPAASAARTPDAFPRRAVLGAALGALVAVGYRRIGFPTQRPLRPPGAADEDIFRGACIRCGNCVRACPSHILQPDFGEHGVTAFMAPVVSFEKDYCHEDCHACNVTCPSGAIARLSLYQKRHVAMGLAKVDLALCFMAKGQDCTACIVQCPYEAVVREDTDGGFSSAPVVDQGKCTGCGACEVACPARPVRAIRVVPTVVSGVSTV